MTEFESCLRRDTTLLRFSPEFATWMILHNVGHDYDCELLCAGWEL